MAKVVRVIEDREEFQKILNENKGIVIIKFGADWCRPCQSISPHVKSLCENLSNVYTLYDLDVDDNFELYAYLKSKKMVNGIPTILAYYSGNTSFASDECVIGTSKEAYNLFFKNCQEKSLQIETNN